MKFKKAVSGLAVALLLTVPVAAQRKNPIELLQLSDSLYSVETQELKDSIDSKCLNVFHNLKAEDEGVIITTQDCIVEEISAMEIDPTNTELSLKYTVDNQEIIVKIRQNYNSDVEVGQKIKAGEVIGVFDKHVKMGADLICISAFQGDTALETSDYVKLS